MAMKDDERYLLAAVQSGEGPEDAASRLRIHVDRARYLLRKWRGAGLWECGDDPFGGALTGRGLVYDVGIPALDVLPLLPDVPPVAEASVDVATDDDDTDTDVFEEEEDD